MNKLEEILDLVERKSRKVFTAWIYRMETLNHLQLI